MMHTTTTVHLANPVDVDITNLTSGQDRVMVMLSSSAGELNLAGGRDVIRRALNDALIAVDRDAP